MTVAGPAAVICGSGIELEPMLDTVDRIIDFAAVPGLGIGLVPGHGYRFVFGRCAGRSVILQVGRRHIYEGFDFARVARPIDFLHENGVEEVILTNAAGGLLSDLAPGRLVSADALWSWPYHGQVWPDTVAPDFQVAGCNASGPHVWMHGPCYETRAEIAALRALGGATVGMSAAPEMQRCRELGLRAAVVSCVTNNCCTPQVLTHEHVLRTAAESSRRLASLLRSHLAQHV